MRFITTGTVLPGGREIQLDELPAIENGTRVRATIEVLDEPEGTGADRAIDSPAAQQEEISEDGRQGSDDKT